MSQRISDLIARRAQRADIYSAPTFWNGKARSYSGLAVSMWKNQTLNACYEREQFSVHRQSDAHPSGARYFGYGMRHWPPFAPLGISGRQITAFDFADEVVRIAKSQNGSGKINYRVQSSFDIYRSCRHMTLSLQSAPDSRLQNTG